VEERTKYFVESPNAAESGRQCNFGHGHFCFVDELLGEENTSGLRDSDRRGAKMLNK
jgi:hypothetical protein